MQMQRDFTVGGQTFQFENQADGTEVISAGGQVLSSLKTKMGGMHQFMHNGKSYDVKVKPGMTGVGFDVTVNGMKQKIAAEKLPAWVMIACGWPLILVLIGGAVGGGLGGLAMGINFGLYRSQLPPAAKVVLNILTGLAAFVLWALVAGAIQSRMVR